MTQLNRTARDIIMLGRQGDGLAAPDKARLRVKLAQRLGVGMAAGSLVSSGALVAEASSSTGLLKLVAGSSLSVKIVGISALVVSTGVGFVGASKLTLQQDAEPRSASAVQQHQRLKPVERQSHESLDGLIAADPAPEPSPQAAPTFNVTSPETRSPTPPASRTDLSVAQSDPAPSEVPAVADDTDMQTPTAVHDLNRQVEAIRQARSAIRAGNGNAALGAIDEVVPPGQSSPLEEESSYSRILALCQVGRVTEARQQAELFLKRFPLSPLSVRVRSSCGFGFGRFPD